MSSSLLCRYAGFYGDTRFLRLLSLSFQSVSFNARYDSPLLSSGFSGSSLTSRAVFFPKIKETCGICMEEKKSGGGGISKDRKNRLCTLCCGKLEVIPLPCTHEKIEMNTFTEYPAVAPTDSISSFGVLLEVHAPASPNQNKRTPVDLVAVLHVCGSELSLKQSAINFVIDHMLPSDRLSLVISSTRAQTILPLWEMNEKGRRDAKRKVNSYLARVRDYSIRDDLNMGINIVNGLNNDDVNVDIVEGLNMGARVLERFGKPNAVKSIILLSHGFVVDTCNHPIYLYMLSPSISSLSRDVNCESNDHKIPVHTFRFGESDYPDYYYGDKEAILEAISDASGGVYSFIESAKSLPTTFTRCIGGLLSVVALDVKLGVASAFPGVEIHDISRGGMLHECETSLYVKEEFIRVGDLYPDEKKEFLVNVSVPKFSHTHQVKTEPKTPLLDISCSYHDPFLKELVQVEGKRIEIRRPSALCPADAVVSLEVDCLRNRILVVEAIAKAKEMEESDNLEGAREILGRTLNTVFISKSSKACLQLLKLLEAKKAEINERIRSQRMKRQQTFKNSPYRIRKFKKYRPFISAGGLLCRPL